MLLDIEIKIKAPHTIIVMELINKLKNIRFFGFRLEEYQINNNPSHSYITVVFHNQHYKINSETIDKYTEKYIDNETKNSY